MINNRLSLRICAVAIAAMGLLNTPSASACGTQGNNPARTVMNRMRAAMVAHLAAARADGRFAQDKLDDGTASIVGMWDLTFFVGSTPEVWDQAFQQFYADGNEMTNDIAVSPSLGNICFGVWKQTGKQTYQLKHYGWNFDEHGNFAGKFVLTATMKVDPSGNSYAGTYVADSLDLAGHIIPELHGAGALKATRIKPD